MSAEKQEPPALPGEVWRGVDEEMVAADDVLGAEELTKIVRRAEAATPGPWGAVSTADDGAILFLSDGDSVYLAHEPTVRFMAEARTDIPRLLASHATLQARLAEAEQKLVQRESARRELLRRSMDADAERDALAAKLRDVQRDLDEFRWAHRERNSG